MIPPKQILIINALSHYKFLTRIQLAKLGVEKYNSAFSKHLRPLIEANYLGMIDATHYGIGHVYYLNKKGALFLSREKKTELYQINYCKNKPTLSSQTLFHRTASIDCQIELYQTCNQEGINVLFYDRDIETLGNVNRDNNLIRKTRIPINNGRYLEPDAIFMLDSPKGRKLYCLEYEHKDYTKKSYQKSLNHVLALNMKSPSLKYNHKKAHRTLFIYQNPATMKSVMHQLNKSVSGINNWFLFKSYDEVNSGGYFKKSIFQSFKKKNFFASWQQCNGERTSLY